MKRMMILGAAALLLATAYVAPAQAKDPGVRPLDQKESFEKNRRGRPHRNRGGGVWFGFGGSGGGYGPHYYHPPRRHYYYAPPPPVYYAPPPPPPTYYYPSHGYGGGVVVIR